MVFSLLCVCSCLRAQCLVTIISGFHNLLSIRGNALSREASRTQGVSLCNRARKRGSKGHNSARSPCAFGLALACQTQTTFPKCALT